MYAGYYGEYIGSGTNRCDFKWLRLFFGACYGKACPCRKKGSCYLYLGKYGYADFYGAFTYHTISAEKKWQIHTMAFAACFTVGDYYDCHSGILPVALYVSVVSAMAVFPCDVF